MGVLKGICLGDVANDFFNNIFYILCGDGFNRIVFFWFYNEIWGYDIKVWFGKEIFVRYYDDTD